MAQLNGWAQGEELVVVAAPAMCVCVCVCGPRDQR